MGEAVRAATMVLAAPPRMSGPFKPIDW